MPFKIRLKKSRQYNVASKSLFVICVELLDSTSVECTLSAESSGRDCLDNVCQRLGLQQPEFFGLRYVSIHDPPRLRWVEMDRPLKRQLDKHAREPNLLLRVMYYVSGVSLLHDEMTRYHYFLQLKSDVIEGRMACDIKQAILLASYSMQAEFGNHDLERHTAEYLKDFALFPKHLTEEGHLEALTEAVICQHAALVGLPQGTAEEYYILAAQQLDGYGQETFNAKDEAGSEVIIGVSLSGIVIGYECSQSSKYYRWKDIANVVNHKRNFAIECPAPEETVQFQFSDPESAKYVWRMCVHQHTFYMQNENACEQGQGFHDQIADTLFKNISEEALLNESREELNSRDGAMSWENQPAVQKAQSTSCLDLTKHTDMEKLRSLLPSYRPAPDYETAMQLKYRSSGQSSSAASVRPSHQVGIMYSSHPEIHQTHMQENVSSYAHYKHFPDVTQVERLYLESRTEDSQRLLKGQSEHSSAVLHTYSTPDLDAGEGNVVQSMQLLQLYKPPPPYPSNRPNSSSTPDLASQTLRPSLTAPQVNSLAGITKDTVVSGSSPDLVSTRNHHYVQQLVTGSETHQQYTNIAAMLDPGLVYCVVPPPEPIYENVPLPWAASARSRTSSIQSAPEMSSNTQNTTGAATSENVKANHAAHELVSFSFPLSGKNRLSSQVSNPVTEATTSSAEVNLLKAETCIDSPHKDSAKQKPKRKWGLLVGGKKSKSIGLTKEKSQEELKHRWSTGLPRLPLPPTISKETMCQLLERKLLDSQLFFEFEKIPKKKHVADFSVALHPDNVVLNRYKDVLPYEENRVRLTPTKDNKFGYINASHITASVGNHQRFYIAAQGPMSSTIMSFWQMVWEADVYLIVQLTGTQEDGAVQYCPGLCDRCLESDQFQVWRQFSQETGHCVTTKLRLFHTPTRSVRGVWHLQYLEWGDQGCPNNVGHFLGFLEELNSVRQHTVSEIPAAHNRNPPILVHCSAGVGRTGITILSDLLLYTLDHNQELDVPRVVAVLRNQRMLLVQTVAQYRFVYSLLIHYLKHSRLI